MSDPEVQAVRQLASYFHESAEDQARADQIQRHIQRHVAEVLKARAEAIEQLCEQMLVTPGAPGIMVDSHNAWFDERVPFGEIWDVSACGSEGVRVAGRLESITDGRSES